MPHRSSDRYFVYSLHQFYYEPLSSLDSIFSLHFAWYCSPTTTWHCPCRSARLSCLLCYWHRDQWLLTPWCCLGPSWHQDSAAGRVLLGYVAPPVSTSMLQCQKFSMVLSLMWGRLPLCLCCLGAMTASLCFYLIIILLKSYHSELD